MPTLSLRAAEVLRRIIFGVTSYLLVSFTEDFSCCLGVEETNDDSGVLSLEIGNSGFRVAQKTLSSRDVNPGQLGSSLQIVQRLK